MDSRVGNNFYFEPIKNSTFQLCPRGEQLREIIDDMCAWRIPLVG